MTTFELTSTHEDYIEVVYRHIQNTPNTGIRITDLATALGCKLPTVTRTVKTLTEAGYLDHKPRKQVRLTATGQKIAEEIAHRHDDAVAFLKNVLGLSEDQAQKDACQLEHGFSPEAAERLHLFMQYYDQLSTSEKNKLQKWVTPKSSTNAFSHLEETKGSGWRV